MLAHRRYKAEPEWLNLIATHCPGGLEAAQVERLLRRHGIIEKRRKGGLAAAEVAQLKELYDRWGRAGGTVAVWEAVQGGSVGGSRVAVWERQCRVDNWLLAVTSPPHPHTASTCTRGAATPLLRSSWPQPQHM